MEYLNELITMVHQLPKDPFMVGVYFGDNKKDIVLKNEERSIEDIVAGAVDEAPSLIVIRRRESFRLYSYLVYVALEHLSPGHALSETLASYIGQTAAQVLETNVPLGECSDKLGQGTVMGPSCPGISMLPLTKADTAGTKVRYYFVAVLSPPPADA